MRIDETALAEADRALLPPIHLVGPAQPTAASVRRAWPGYIIGWVAAVAAILAILNNDVAHLANSWWNNETYGHCLLIPPILAWLVWQRREALAKIAPKPWWPGALLILGSGLVWIVGELAGVALLRHTAIILTLIFSVPTIFGLAVARGVTFPLFFALFLIPVGEQFEPFLQTITAEFATYFLRAIGVPTHMDGVFISIPNGDFEVAQACSGIRFLIAMAAFGALVANVCFKSWKRRLIFMAFALSLPVLANGVRVWGTIYAAHLTTPEVARGIDHVVYGWVFFAIVMIVLLAVSWKYFDRPVDDPFIDPAKLQQPGALPGLLTRLAAVALLAVGAGAAAPTWARIIALQGPDRVTTALSITPPPGWSITAYKGLPWRPIYKNPSAEQFSSFSDRSGDTVDVYVALFDRQYEGHEIVGFGQGVFEDQEAQSWSWAANARAPAGASGLQINRGPFVRDIVQYYWVNGKLTGSPYTAKVEGLKARLLGGEPRAATLVLSAERTDPLVSARPAIDRYIAAMGPPARVIQQSVVASR